jgi:hypothetical protein
MIPRTRIVRAVLVTIGLILLALFLNELVPGAFNDACNRAEIGSCD